jgi:hypothetical protein
MTTINGGNDDMNISRWVLLLLTVPHVAFAQQATNAASSSKPWFGVTLPLAFESDPAVIVGDRMPRSMTLSDAAPLRRDPELQGTTIRKDLETIVGFSKASRSEREIGSGQLWGRIAGFPSGTKTIEWAADQLRRAGIDDVKMQLIEQESRASFWMPQSWELKLLGDAAFGIGTTDVILDSAIPLPPSQIPNGKLIAPLVFVSTANPSLLEHIDVKGKIAVQLTVPQGHMVFERSVVTSRAQDLMKRGALAVINLVRLPGNERSRDFSNCGGPCFNLGGRDGLFLESVLDRATQAGLRDKVQAQLTLTSASHAGLKSQNAVAVIPGRSSDDVIVIDAHADAWFDGAGDNADGLAVMLALARHFAKAEHRPKRSLVFVVSAGHHTPGINGPRNFVKANPELAKKAVLVLNIEHVAQRNFSAARTVASDGYRHAVADSGEAPIVFGVSNAAPFLNDLAQQGVARFGVNLVSDRSTMQSGETGGFDEIKNAKITVMQAPPLYHTTGEGIEVISTPGLERMARFLAFFIREVANASSAKINPAAMPGNATINPPRQPD